MLALFRDDLSLVAARAAPHLGKPTGDLGARRALDAVFADAPRPPAPAPQG